MSKRIKQQTEAGQGGKLGHSNMAYWGENDEAKDEARKQRRREIPKVINRDVEEWIEEDQSDGSN